jgi:putative SOS response-associated peptidase YedK
MDCRLDMASAEIAAAFDVDPGPDPWCGGPTAIGQFAPVIVKAGRSARKLIRPMHWGYPAPGQATEMAAPGSVRWVGHVRNLQSPFWIGNLRHVELRCLIPMTSFSLPVGGKGKRMQCSLDGGGVMAAAGIWRDLTDMPVFAMLTVDASEALRPVEGGAMPQSMPALLDKAAQEQWLRAEWKEAASLVAPYSGSDLRVELLG